MPDNTPFDPARFPTSTLLSVNGIELEVFEAGREHGGRPVVLCHGFPEHAFSWRHQVRALVDAGHHVIVLNQRGYGRSSRPADVTAYDVEHLTGDLVALLDHLGHEDATFVGHDWGAMVVWWLALLHPARVHSLVALSVPYIARGPLPWIELMEQALGSDYYFVHVNRQPGVTDAALDADPARFLRNLYRTSDAPPAPTSGNWLMEVAAQDVPTGEPLMSDRELAVLVDAARATGFTGGLNWYRNLDRNWHLLADVDPVVHTPALMVYGERDTVMRAPDLADLVPAVEVVTLDCGHWIQQERPQETNRLLLDWLVRRG